MGESWHIPNMELQDKETSQAQTRSVEGEEGKQAEKHFFRTKTPGPRSSCTSHEQKRTESKHRRTQVCEAAHRGKSVRLGTDEGISTLSQQIQAARPGILKGTLNFDERKTVTGQYWSPYERTVQTENISELIHWARKIEFESCK